MPLTMVPIYSMISVRQICLPTHLFHKTGKIYVHNESQKWSKTQLGFNYNKTVNPTVVYILYLGIKDK
jgi:hypothetical protein